MEPIYEQVEDCEEPRGGRTGERHVHDKLNAKDSNETWAQDDENDKHHDVNHVKLANPVDGPSADKDISLVMNAGVEGIGHSNENGTTLPFLCIPTLPGPIYYKKPLNMVMESMMTQGEYEKAIRASFDAVGSALANEADRNEMISTICVDKGVEYHFELSRAALGRSDVLEKIFTSKNFHSGSKTLLRFNEESVRCFQILKIYLEDAKERFAAKDLLFYATHNVQFAKSSGSLIPCNEDQLSKSATMFSNTSTIGTLAGLHKLADRLGLNHLAELTMTTLEDKGAVMDTFCCMNLANLVFTQGLFPPIIETFCFDSIGKHFKSLNDSSIWHDVVEKLKGSRLAVVWAEMQLTNESNRLESDSCVAYDPTMVDAKLCPIKFDIHSTAYPSKASSTALKVENVRSKGSIRQKGTVPERAVHRSVSADQIHLNSEISSKVKSDSTESPETCGRHVSFDETCKARKVLGMNTDGGGKIAGRRKQTLGRRARVHATRAAEKGVKTVIG